MFKFKLEKLLKIRKKEEEDLGNLYALKLKEIEKEKINLNKIKEEKNKIKKDKIKKKLIASELVQLQNYLIAIKKRENEQIFKIKELENKAENLKNQLLEARKKRKILETLKERQYLKYLQNEKLAEQKTIDEIGVIRHLKKK